MKIASKPHPEIPVSAPVVLYDGSCPLCAREIAHYRRLRGAQRIDWVDIAREPDLEGRYGVRPADAMARFHVRDGQGRWLTGAFAFAELWSHLPGYRLAGSALRALRLLSLLDRAYTPFARWRLSRRCDDGACGVQGRNAGNVTNNQ
jgi:predicted DCC family thiol-disulfide oxidoreductase YuxK